MSKINAKKLSAVLAVLVLAGIVLVGAGAASTVDSGTCGDNLTWVLTDDGTLTISGIGAMSDYSSEGAPWYQYRSQMTKLVLEDGLTTIGDYAFYYCSGFTGSLTIPDSVTSIGKYSFYNCNGFTGSLTIPSNVTTIGYFAFSYCTDFTGELVIPSSVTTIEYGAFYYCSGFSGSLTIPSNVTKIGVSAFQNCSGFSGYIVIPNSVTTIGISAFTGCSGLTDIIVNSDNPNYSSDSQGILYNKDKTTLHTCPAGKTGSFITIPSSVTSIGNYAFVNCRGFTGSLTIPSSVTKIGYWAFYGCNGFTGSLVIPDSVTSIGENAFRDCSGLTSVTVPSSVTSIGDRAFYNLHSNSVIYAECSESLLLGKYSTYKTALAKDNGDNSFTFTVDTTKFPSGFPLTDANAPVKDGQIFEGWYANSEYTGEKVTTVTNGQTLYAKWTGSGIVDSGTCGDNLTWVLTDDGTLTISGTGAMYDYDSSTNRAPWYQYRSQMTKLVLHDGLTTIGNWAFYNCSGFTGSLTIPSSVTTIGGWAFSYCSGFTGSLTIPSSITTIGDGAFAGCSGLTDIIVNSENPNYSSDSQGILYNKDKTTLLTCPAGKTGSFITIPSSVTTIGNSAFWDCSGFTGSLTIPSSVTSIGVNAFAYCRGFTGSLVIPDSVTSIGIQAFMDCSGLTGSLTIPSSVTTIGGLAFEGCSGLTSITVPSSVTSIGIKAFYNLHSNSVIYAECSESLLSDEYSTDKTALAKDNGDNSFTFTVDETSFPSGFSLTDDNAPVKDGQIFNGWYANSEYTGEKVTTVTNGQTIYAKWTGSGIVASGTCGDNLTWVLTDDGTLTISGTGAMYNYEYQGAPWYQYRSQMTKLVLEDGLTTISYCAFDGCGFTGSLVIPDSVTTIGTGAFCNCSGFTGSLVIPDSVTTIGGWAFNGCRGFTGSLVIPDSVTTIGDAAFSDMKGIENIYVDSNNAFYNDIEGVLFTKDGTKLINCPARKVVESYVIPSSVTTIGSHAFYCCSGFTGSLVIPDSVTSIGNYAFSGCSGLTSVTIPSSVTTIGSQAFYNLHSNSVIYAECSESLLSGKYSTDKTAIAKDNGDNSFTFTVDTTSFPSGFPLNDANAPVKDGQIFNGWYANSEYTGDKVTTVTDGQTLYAKWGETPTEPTYSVTYNANGADSGNVPTDSAEYRSGNSVTVLGNTGILAKADYTFTGWNSRADGSGNSYNAGDTFTITKDVTLYAVWEYSGVQYVVSIDPVTISALPLNLTFDELGLPEKLTVTTDRGTKKSLPVVWDSSTYDSTLKGSQTIDGTLQLPDNYETLVEPVATIILSDKYVGIADIVFIIDTTGSMHNEINNVVKNLKTFTDEIDALGISTRWALVEYRDITCDGNGSTKLHPSSKGTWYTDVSELQNSISALRNVNGGGDTPETVIDGLEKGRLLDMRDDAGKFFITITDADWKVNNQYGITSMEQMISRLVTDEVHTSVVTAESYFDDYCNLTEETDGLLVNIYGNFSDELRKLIDLITIVVEERNVSELVITTPPAKTVYTEGELFDKTGMVVTLMFDDSRSRVTTSYAVLPSGPLTTSDTKVTVSFGKVSADLPITVNPGPTYTVTYNANHADSGEVPVDDGNYAANTKVTVLGNTGTLDKSGYTFSGWNTKADGTGVTYKAGETFAITGDTTLYALWNEIVVVTYTVTYQANGADDGNVPVDELDYRAGDIASVYGNINNLEKSGYTFSGWNTNANGTGTSYKAGDVITISGNVVLYAQWVEIPAAVYPVTVTSTTGGSASASASSAAAGTVITLTASADTGYTFKEWQVVSGGVTITGNTFTMPACAVEIKAVFESTGTADTLQLRAGWNFISVPMKLDASMDTASEYFGEVDMEGHAVFGYDSNTKQWVQLTASTVLEPLDAYWVYSKTDFVGTKKIVFDTNSMSLGNTKEIYKGWNAVGLNIDVRDGTDSLSAKSMFAGLSWNRYFESYTTGYWKVIVNGGSSSEGEENNVYAWAGGWLYANEDGILVGNAI